MNHPPYVDFVNGVFFRAREMTKDIKDIKFILTIINTKFSQ